MRRLTGPLAAIVALLALEGLYFLWFAYVLARLFRGASNSASVAMPSAVWTNGTLGVMLVFFAVASATDLGGFRRCLRPLAVMALGYGAWCIWSGFPLMTSFTAALQGDVVALGVWSGIGFVAIGGLGLVFHYRRAA